MQTSAAWIGTLRYDDENNGAGTIQSARCVPLTVRVKYRSSLRHESEVVLFLYLIHHNEPLLLPLSGEVIEPFQQEDMIFSKVVVVSIILGR